METETGTHTASGTGNETDTGVGMAAPPTGLDAVADEAADVDSVEALLDQVDHALTRLDDGSYGRCETCGTIIADQRLAEVPTARTCAGCRVPVAG
jgi:RNA polymerase-binding transcription factor DksA